VNCEITDPAGHPVIVMRQGEPGDRSDRGSARRRVDFSVLIRVACRKRIAFTGRSECQEARHRSVLAFVSVATSISRAAGALIWLTNLLGNRTREKSSPPRKRRQRRRPRKKRRGRQRSRNRPAIKAEAVGSRIPTNPDGPPTEQAIVGRLSELRTGDGASPSSDESFHRGRQVVRRAGVRVGCRHSPQRTASVTRLLVRPVQMLQPGDANRNDHQWSGRGEGEPSAGSPPRSAAIFNALARQATSSSLPSVTRASDTG